MTFDFTGRTALVTGAASGIAPIQLSMQAAPRTAVVGTPVARSPATVT